MIEDFRSRHLETMPTAKQLLFNDILDVASAVLEHGSDNKWTDANALAKMFVGIFTEDDKVVLQKEKNKIIANNAMLGYFIKNWETLRLNPKI